ncbi:hypothetical protein TNCV_3052221 [Trichonephila clavipes]|nr:hypothetical protein TNCV_3052221 [Trichonephila clavipes]
MWTSPVVEEAQGQADKQMANNLMYNDQTIKITSSCDVWMMTKSEVRVAAILGCNHCHTPRHVIKEALDVCLGNSNPFGLHILPKKIWYHSGWCTQA